MLSIADGGLCDEVEEGAKPVDVAEWVRVQELLRYIHIYIKRSTGCVPMLVILR